MRRDVEDKRKLEGLHLTLALSLGVTWFARELDCPFHLVELPHRHSLLGCLSTPSLRVESRGGDRLGDKTLAFDLTISAALEPVGGPIDRVDLTVHLHACWEEGDDVGPLEPALFVVVPRDTTPILWLFASDTDVGAPTAWKTSCPHVHQDVSECLHVVVDQVLRHLVERDVIVRLVRDTAGLTGLGRFGLVWRSSVHR